MRDITHHTTKGFCCFLLLGKFGKFTTNAKMLEIFGTTLTELLRGGDVPFPPSISMWPISESHSSEFWCGGVSFGWWFRTGGWDLSAPPRWSVWGDLFASLPPLNRHILINKTQAYYGQVPTCEYEGWVLHPHPYRVSFPTLNSLFVGQQLCRCGNK